MKGRKTGRKGGVCNRNLIANPREIKSANRKRMTVRFSFRENKYLTGEGLQMVFPKIVAFLFILAKEKESCN